MESAEQAEQAVRESFGLVQAAKAAQEQFGETCAEAHEYLSDKEISDLINGDYSRSTIQSMRQKAEQRIKRS